MKANVIRQETFVARVFGSVPSLQMVTSYGKASELKGASRMILHKDLVNIQFLDVFLFNVKVVFRCHLDHKWSLLLE